MRKNVDILLIPPIVCPIFSDDFNNFIPVGLLALSASLERKGLTSKIYSPHRSPRCIEDYRVIAEEISSNSAKSIGFSTWSIGFPSIIYISRELKKRNHKLPILLGGPQASILGREILKFNENFDYILKGEADFTLPDFLDLLLRNQNNSFVNIPGLVFRDRVTQRIIQNDGYGFVTNLNELPIPKYDGFFIGDCPALDIGRGCPFKCTFCTTSNFFSNKYRIKSTSRIISEMDYCYKVTGKSYMGFLHDNLTFNKAFVIKLCDDLARHNKKTGCNYTWHCSARTDCINDELLSKMYEAGCRSIFYGIESGSSKIQKKIRKNLNLKDAHRMVKTTIKEGITPIVSYIIGFPDEARTDLEKTIRSVIKMHLAGSHVQVSLLSILPGTPLFNKYKKNLEFDGIFSDFSKGNPYHTEDEIIKTNKELFSAFYYLPNQNYSREELVLMNNLLNILTDFKLTCRTLKDNILKDLKKYNILELIKVFEKVYPNKKLISKPDYEFFIHGLKDYVLYAIKNNAAETIVDLFLLECTIATVKAKYSTIPVQNQNHDTNYEFYNKQLHNNAFYIRPIWEVVKTFHDLRELNSGSLIHIMRDPDSLKSSIFCLVVATSEKKAQIFLLNDGQYQMLTNLRGKSYVPNLNNLAINYMDDKNLNNFILQLLEIGVLSKKPFQYQN